MRSGFTMTLRTVTSEPGTTRAATIGKAAEDGSPGTTTFVPVRRTPLTKPDGPVHRLDVAAEGAEHVLAVIAALCGLDHFDIAVRT